MEILSKIDSLVWGPPLLILLVGTGLYLTIRLRMLQIFRLPLAIKYLFSKNNLMEKETYQVLHHFVQPLLRQLEQEIL